MRREAEGRAREVDEMVRELGTPVVVREGLLDGDSDDEDDDDGCVGASGGDGGIGESPAGGDQGRPAGPTKESQAQASTSAVRLLFLRESPPCPAP